MEIEFRYAEEPTAGLVDRRRKVWLECNGQPFDFRAADVVRTRFVVRDIEVVSFVCPRCGNEHQSLLFG